MIYRPNPRAPRPRAASTRGPRRTAVLDMQGEPLVVYPAEWSGRRSRNGFPFYVFYDNREFNPHQQGVHLQIQRPLLVDADFNSDEDIPFDERVRGGVSTRRVNFNFLVDLAYRSSKDGVVIQNISEWPEEDDFSRESNVYIVFDLAQVIPIEAPRANRTHRAPRRNPEPRATLFDSRMRVLGTCLDLPNAIAKAFMEVPDAAFVRTQGEGSIDPQPGLRSREDYEDRMGDWNYADSGFVERPSIPPRRSLRGGRR